MIRYIYSALYSLLKNTHHINPLIPKKAFGNKIEYGFISSDHLQNSKLDDQLDQDLIKAGIEVKPYAIDTIAFENFLSQNLYPKDYYAERSDQRSNFKEKALEHYVTLQLIQPKANHVHIDIAAATSPFSDLLKYVIKDTTVYKQDLIYKPGVNGNRIGGYAHEIPFDDNSVDSVTLHCSLEHFENSSDIELFRTLNRILKPGGLCIIAPFYIASKYCIHLDPVFNLIKQHHPVLDTNAEIRYCFWKQYHSRHYDVAAIRKRILQGNENLSLQVLRITNFKDAFEQSYLRYIGILSKQI
ncbi:MAG TPA: methyltransferase domain-containing protein [Bacteroidia bacterium]|nr:methyltransferase domain-containing protein [Bacteroidia bacterium]HNT81002.1 methyltransferase domain-containing protein [Bacteroidia bacterium]